MIEERLAEGRCLLGKDWLVLGAWCRRARERLAGHTRMAVGRAKLGWLGWPSSR